MDKYPRVISPVITCAVIKNSRHITANNCLDVRAWICVESGWVEAVVQNKVGPLPSPIKVQYQVSAMTFAKV